MSGIGDPFRKLKPGEPFVPVAAQFNMLIEDAQARRTQGQRLDSSSVVVDESTLNVLVRNDYEEDLDAFSMIRWSGPPIKAPILGGRLPKPQFKTIDVDEPEQPIGVTLQKIRQSSGSGAVACFGVCLCRVYGAFFKGDLLEPDSQFRGILATSSSSSVMALANGPGSGEEGIIPVLIGAGPSTPDSGTFVKIYTLAIRGTADSGTISWEAKKTVIVDDEPTAVTETGTWDFDSDETDIQTSLVVLDSGVLVIGGDIRWNICKIKFSDPTARLKITATSLTREEHGITPQAELSWCSENEAAWWY